MQQLGQAKIIFLPWAKIVDAPLVALKVHGDNENLSAVREIKFQRQECLNTGNESVRQPYFALLLPSPSRTSQPSESRAGRREHPRSCVFFISRSCSITCCFCILGRTSMLFCTGSGRWRAMTSGLVAVANSSSAACGVVPCHANKGTADNSVARSQWLFIEHLRGNQTPRRR